MKTCPQCHLLLEPIQWEGVTVHACRSCGGCWFAASDFGQAMAASRARLAQLNALFPGIASAGAFEGLPKPCPDCRTVLLERKPLAQAAEITAMACAQCGGVWLEPGERTALVEPSQPSPPLPPSRERGPGGEGFPAAPAPPVPMEEAGAETVPAPAPAVETAGEAAPAAILPEVKPEEAGEPGEAPGPVVVTALPPEPVAPPGPPPAFDLPVPPPSVRPGPEETVSAADAERAALLAELVAAGDSFVCPRCQKVYARDRIECPDCRVGLVEPDFQVRCPSCNAANSFINERCRKCGAALRTPQMLDRFYPKRSLAGQRDELHHPHLLTEPETGPSTPAAPPVYSHLTAERWCPQCRRGFPATMSFCTFCGVGLALPSFRIRCRQCNSENTISAQRCWKCQADLHPMESPARRETDMDRWPDLSPPPVRTSQQGCQTSVFLALGLVALFITWLWTLLR
jgi:Zn-finger nucleic acid-binding protein